MKTLISLFFLLAIVSVSNAQNFRKTDKSPMDMAYFPDNFAHDRTDGEEAIIRVTYSRPFKNNREVFGGIIPYDEVWRTGANEAAEIKLYKDIQVDGKQLAKGSYSLFTIPGESEWTIIFNAGLDYWGAYSYNKEDDVLRVNAQSTSRTEVVENFTIQFSGSDGHGVMYLSWDKTVVEVPFSY